MIIDSSIGKRFNFFGTNWVTDSVTIKGLNLSEDPCVTAISIDAHRPVKGENDNPFGIKRVIFNGPATIVFWLDGTKTVVKCAEGETNDKKTSILWAYAKKICGTSSHMNKVLDKLVEE